jgi:membrane associated rhomboid family serine protease
LSYARVFLGLIILIAVAFLLLKVAIVAAIFGVFALVVLAIILKEGL